jgi:hypothetical protein
MGGKTCLRLLLAGVLFSVSSLVFGTCLLLAFYGIEVQLWVMWMIAGISVLCLVLSLVMVALSPEETSVHGEAEHFRDKVRPRSDCFAVRTGNAPEPLSTIINPGSRWR